MLIFEGRCIEILTTTILISSMRVRKGPSIFLHYVFPVFDNPVISSVSRVYLKPIPNDKDGMIGRCVTRVGFVVDSCVGKHYINKPIQNTTFFKAAKIDNF